jgi:hypothetical protein
MSKSFTLEMLTEGIRQRHLGAQNKRLVEKWTRTGLLRGLNETGRENMARLLENQAAQVLKEASSVGTGGGAGTASGDLRGFSNIAFPIVRRVFGGLVANELVSVQPMSLPSGLLFYLDYTYGSNVGDAAAPTYVAGESIYNSPVGKGVRSGSLGVGGQYDLVGSGFSRVHLQTAAVTLLASGAFGGTTTFSNGKVLHATGTDGKLLGFDPQVADAIETNPVPGGAVGPGVYTAVLVPFSTALFGSADATMVKDFGLHLAAGGDGVVYKRVSTSIQAGGNLLNVRRLNRLGVWDGASFVDNPLVPAGAAGAAILMVVSGANAAGTVQDATLAVDFVLADSLNTDNDGSTLTIPSFESTLVDPSSTASGVSPAIPEIDIKVESIAVTAVTRKLRAKWSPELAQDLNAYHSLDAEVELTQILSEQIAMELDREILNDLLTQATGANFFWSRAPGKFVNKVTGAEVTRGTGSPGPAFTGTVREWYETFVETIIDVANQIHRKTLRGSANFIVVGPDLATILEASVYYRPSYTLDGQGQVSAPMSIGAEKVGTLSGRFTVYKDPYFPRNKVLVGYKGGSYLETGYVYAPYVPLIVTPTIFNPDDFTPRKGVMTRYGKKMVRADFYGTVTVLDLNII